MNTYYLAHHGVSGMKWGVWNEETRARYTGRGGRSASRAKRIDKNLQKAEIADIKGKNKKSEKLQKKAAYLKELEEPGSTSLDSKFLKGKRLKNIAGALYGGASVVSNINAAITGPLAIPLYSAAWGPVAGPMVGVGLAAVNAGAAAGWTKVTMDSLKRAGDLNTTITNRKESKQTSKKARR